MKKFEIMKNLYSSKALLKITGGGMHPPHSPPWIRPCGSNHHDISEHTLEAQGHITEVYDANSVTWNKKIILLNKNFVSWTEFSS